MTPPDRDLLYLPRKARETLTDAEYRRTTARKRADAKHGRPFSRQPEDVAAKAAAARRASHGSGGRSKTELLAEARRRDIPGRSRMSKAELERALPR